MKKPTAINPKLQQLVDQLWTNDHHRIGDGSMADAIRQEIKTGLPTKGRFHKTKGRAMIVALQKWLAVKLAQSQIVTKRLRVRLSKTSKTP
jgi:hypothetical protein